MNEEQKEYIRKVVWEVLREMDYSSRLTEVEVEVEETLNSFGGNIEEIRRDISAIEFKLGEIEKEIEEIKDSYMFDNVVDFTVVLNKRFAEINAGISEILRRI